MARERTLLSLGTTVTWPAPFIRGATDSFFLNVANKSNNCRDAMNAINLHWPQLDSDLQVEGFALLTGAEVGWALEPPSERPSVAKTKKKEENFTGPRTREESLSKRRRRRRNGILFRELINYSLLRSHSQAREINCTAISYQESTFRFLERIVTVVASISAFFLSATASLSTRYSISPLFP